MQVVRIAVALIARTDFTFNTVRVCRQFELYYRLIVRRWSNQGFHQLLLQVPLLREVFKDCPVPVGPTMQEGY